MSTERMRVGQFADAAGVSPRTVRYYVVEGLLPPPEGAGMGASYGPEHLDRLRLILRLKDAYLPLREIRRQITGLTDEEIRQRLREMEATEARARGRSSGEPGVAERRGGRRDGSAASDYLRRIGEDRSPVAPEPPAVPLPDASTLPERRFGRAPSSPAPLNRSPSQEDRPEPAPTPAPAPDPNAPSYPGYVTTSSPLRLGSAIPAAAPPEPPMETDEDVARGDREPTAEHWVRLRIGDDAELLIRSGAYHRLRDKVEWLVGWARTIFR